ncbi:uncharacterized protein TNCT_566501 [Trichonephila clavata]|uniref:Uncharacterized protein n=1 Tax=Trichonephila clavata TaxID=2740835 RepID=A0A8X6LN61_TRICU|nr:uncharacterized protein TNCT_566501 [Trichonephila clavata]
MGDLTLKYGCRRHCPQCNKTQGNGYNRLWRDIPPMKAILPPMFSPIEECEDSCCFLRTGTGTCMRCDHIPPPLLRFNYSTRDGEFDPKSKLATFQTETNSYHGRKPLLELKESIDPCNMRTPRFLEISPVSLRFGDQRP